MPESNVDFNLDFKDNKISAELDQNGEIKSLEAKINGIRAWIRKKPSKKEIDRLKFDITGIPQLATDAPFPPDREELTEKEFSTKTLCFKPWFTGVVTVAAIIFDFFCYYGMFQALVGTRDPLQLGHYLAAIAAAMAIDILPAFFAHIVHSIIKNKKIVYGVFLFISIIFISVFLLVCFAVRCEYFSKNYDIDDMIVVQVLIPIATTLVCFILNYLSYDPYHKELKILRKLKLSRTENINELNALISEIEADTNYMDRLKEMDEESYKSTKEYIESVSDYYRVLVRVALMLKQHSPADTSDISLYVLNSFSRSPSITVSRDTEV